METTITPNEDKTMMTKNVAAFPPPIEEAKQSDSETPPATPTAWVKRADQGHFELQTGDSVRAAQCAFSCLVNPEVGDKVSFMLDDQQNCYILHVLERQNDTTTIKVRGNLEIQADRGMISLAAAERLNLLSGDSCSLAAPKLTALAPKAEFDLAHITATGEKLDATYKDINIVAHSLTTVADLLMQRVKNSVRAIEILEKVDAGQVISRVRNLFSLRSRQAMITAEQDVKIDGDRIHLG